MAIWFHFYENGSFIHLSVSEINLGSVAHDVYTEFLIRNPIPQPSLAVIFSLVQVYPFIKAFVFLGKGL